MDLVDVQFKERYSTSWNMDEYGSFYVYVKPEELTLIPGDYVVVETRYGLALAIVLQVRENQSTQGKITEKIVTKVEGYNLVDEENRKKRKEELESKLKDFEKRLKDEERYNLILKTFPEAKSLIDEYKDLTK